MTFTNLSALSHAYGSPSVELAKEVIKRSAEGQIYGGIFLVVLAVILTVACALCFRAISDTSKYSNDEKFACLGAASGFAAFVLAVIALWGFFDVWQWTALFNPNLALAHKIFGSLGG